MECILAKEATYESDFDGRRFLDTYYHGDLATTDQGMIFSLENLHRFFARGCIKGDCMIEIGCGPTIFQVISSCEHFKKIYLTDYSEANLQEVDRWLNDEEDAFDWTPYMKYVCNLEGGRTTPEEKSDKIRKSVTLMRCDVTQANPMQPAVLPLADCVIISECLTSACKTLEDFTAALKNISSLLNPGGYLILSDILGGSYYLVGEANFPVLPLEEKFIKRAMADVGFTIEEFKALYPEQSYMVNTCDCQNIFYLLGRKL
ncbi:nicotinamide N-methyltransferase-like [Ascaphus truei]|uniref:nicotinamide N-methyltransferase-like n=1 Tax=Ascaphus truei TaxID=8439 RepID=UPI003F5AB543